MKNVAICGDCSMQLIEAELSKDFNVSSFPGFNSWRQACLQPEFWQKFKPDIILVVLTEFNGDITRFISSITDSFKKAQVFVWGATNFPQISNLATIDRYQEPEMYDERLQKLASQPFSLKGLKKLHSDILKFSKNTDSPKKVLAIDLDGVLWNGVSAEENVVIDVKAVEILKFLKSNGVILTVLSKNNLNDVIDLLPKNLFTITSINWESKAENLLNQAKELNLLPSAFVFCDDNPVERQEVKTFLPEVDCASSISEIQFAKYFFSSVLTREDALRNADYEMDGKRAELKRNLTYRDYLKTLQIKTEIRNAKKDDIERIVQLSIRTHQFTFSGRILTEDEVLSDLDSFFVVTSRDIFADQGIVAFARLKNGILTDFSMSCRAMGRQIEHSVLSNLKPEKVMFTLTKQNEPARRFLEEQNLWHL